MRTTLTVEDDVAVMLERARADRGCTMKQLINDLLRQALTGLGQRGGERRPRYEVRPFPIERAPSGSVDDVAAALELAEGDGFR